MIEFYIIFQTMSKGSIQSFSFQLTHPNLDLPSKSLLQSPMKLEYSISELSISQMLDAQPTFSIHIKHQYTFPLQQSTHQSTFQHRNSHFLEVADSFQHIFGSYVANTKPHTTIFAKAKYQNHQNTSHYTSSSTSKRQKKPQNKSNDPHPILNYSLCIRSKAFQQSKTIHNCKQNQQSLEKTKNANLRDDTKPKNTSRHILNSHDRQPTAKSTQHTSKKLIKEGLNELGSGVTTKRLNLSQNEMQVRKYMEKINLNRQNNLHQCHKFCMLPPL